MQGVHPVAKIIDEAQRMALVSHQIEAARSIRETESIVMEVLKGFAETKFNYRILSSIAQGKGIVRIGNELVALPYALRHSIAQRAYGGAQIALRSGGRA